MASKAALFVVVISFAASSLVFAAPTPKFRNLSITVDNIMELFIDGIQIRNLTNYNNRYKADKVALSSGARVLAVKGTDQGLVAGILGSTDDGFVRTDSSWKCTGKYHPGWQTVDFDDSAWPAAHQAGTHLTKPWTPVSGIRKDAYWIWTSRNSGADLVVYCRKDLVRKVPPSTCPGRTLDITVDSVMDLYVDGTKVPDLPNYYNWRTADSVCLASHPTIIAVKGIGQGHRGGILASSEDGFIQTNSSWKCTNKYFPGWEKETFDDYAWPAAYQVGLHETYPRSFVSGIRTDVYWIWTSRRNGTDKVAYCRKLLVHHSESGVFEDEDEVNKRPVFELFVVKARDADNSVEDA